MSIARHVMLRLSGALMFPLLTIAPFLSGCSGKQDTREAEALAMLRRMGGVIETSGDPSAEHFTVGVSLTGDQVDDAGIECLRHLTYLRMLAINHCQNVTDAGLHHLRSGMSDLETLDLGYTRGASDAGLEYLQGLTKLKTLDLRYTAVKGPGLRHLAGLTSLNTLVLKGTEIDDKVLEHVAKISNLHTLDLSRTQITGSGLRYLERLNRLEDLDLSESAITDDGLVNLRAWPALRRLSLWKTQITDEGLKHLEVFGNLRYLNVEDTHVTYEGRRSLRKSTAAIEHCAIHSERQLNAP